MSFIIDKQTLNDLGVFSMKKEVSVFGIYNTVRTRGGARILEEIFENPLDDAVAIRRRSALIDFFRRENTEFPFRTAWFDAAEFYLSDRDARTRISGEQNLLYQKFRHLMKTDTEYRQLRDGIVSLSRIIRTLHDFINGNTGAGGPEFREFSKGILSILESGDFRKIITEDPEKMTSDPSGTAVLDAVFRYGRTDDVKRILDCVYRLDVYISAARVAAEKGFVTAEVLPAAENVMELKGLRHPALSAPVTNDISIDCRHNVIFLTGANMAGKSTFMKAFGIAVFLAHVGFPVPASSMRFSVRDGLYTTINLPDNLNRGYSHFYAEVRRLRKVAQTLGSCRNMVVIFDELFRGTNVKDAYDATVAVTGAFATITGSIFIISTHIIEAGEKLAETCSNIRFLYLPAEMEGNHPKYTYRLREGITEDRHGMLIIRNEGILDILK